MLLEILPSEFSQAANDGEPNQNPVLRGVVANNACTSHAIMVRPAAYQRGPM